MGDCVDMITSNVELIRNKYMVGRVEFMERNPEINLPPDLNIDLSMEEFSCLAQDQNTPVTYPFKDGVSELENSWIKIAKKGLKPSTSKDSFNDRCNMEC